MVMTRVPLQTVTQRSIKDRRTALFPKKKQSKRGAAKRGGGDIPVLVDAAGEKGGADGWVVCFPPRSYIKHASVRKVSPTDVMERRRKIFTPEELFVYVGAQQLKQAYHTASRLKFRTNRAIELDISQAFDRMRPGLPGQKIPGVRVQWRVPGFTSENDRVGVRGLYASLMCNAMKDARLVIWCSDKEDRFLPGFYCPDWKTAAFVHLFMKHIFVCPKCKEPFIPKTDNQGYCRKEHGVAHRTFRSRFNKRQREAEQKAAELKSKK